MSRRQGLLAQIEAGALDSKTPLIDVLRKCLILGGHAGSTELRDWARLELDGYDEDSEVPSYRRIYAPLLADGMKGTWQFTRKQVAIDELPDFTREALREGLAIPFGVGQLEKMAKKSEATGLQPDRLSSLTYYLNHSGDYQASFERLYYNVSPHAVGGILDAVRTKLTAMVAELRATGFSGDQIPSQAAADQAVQVVIRGAKRSPITINNAHATGAGTTATITQQPVSDEPSEIPGWIRGPWGVGLGIATLAATYAAFATGLHWPPF